MFYFDIMLYNNLVTLMVVVDLVFHFLFKTDPNIVSASSHLLYLNCCKFYEMSCKDFKILSLKMSGKHDFVDQHWL